MSAAPPAALVPAGVPRLERTSTVPEAAPAPPVTPAAPEPPAQPDDPRHAWLTGIVVDASAAPVAGAEVAVLATLSGDNTIAFQMDRDFHARLERVARTESGADGRFRVRLPRGLPFDVVATAQGHADGLAPLCHAGEDVRIELDVALCVNVAETAFDPEFSVEGRRMILRDQTAKRRGRSSPGRATRAHG
jgi:hypothetical protein